MARRSTTPEAEGRGRRERPCQPAAGRADGWCEGLRRPRPKAEAGENVRLEPSSRARPRAAGSRLGLRVWQARSSCARSVGAFELREVGRRVRAARGRSARSSCAISVVGRRGLGEDAPWTPRACGRWPLEESSWSLGECGQPAPATSSLATRCCRRRLSKRCGQPVPLPCPRRAGRATGTGYPRRGTLPTPALTTGGATSDDPAGRRKRTVQPRRWLAPSCLAPEAPGSALTRRTRHEYYAESR